MRAVAVAGFCLLLACAGAAASASRASRSDTSVFGGLGTWVDIYDAGVYAAPEQTAARIAARGIVTVWVETGNYHSASDIVNPARLARLMEALHADGVRVVGWYLPGHTSPALDTRRALAMLSFRTPNGQALDGVALDIESTRLRNVGLRSRRAVALAQRVRQAAPQTPLAIIPFNPRGLERHPHTWPAFPWAQLAATADAFAPMIYTSSSVKGFDATYGYVTRALRLLRDDTGEPDVPIHVIGGVANGLGPEEVAGFAAAVSDDGGTIGVSLYDWTTTRPAEWPVLSSLSG
ncbi:MAG: hypothetical protein E6G11_13380 [Actinobacteria bacterium]|nr:MAG: hypothetical protein E6G11_13380 [Actinomycetota bacterium]